MSPKRKEELPPEQDAAERDAAVDRAAGEAASRPEVKFDFGPRGYGMLTARETPALAWGINAAAGDASPLLMEQDLNLIKHRLRRFGEQRLEIVQLREDTRQVLAGLSPA